MVIYTATTTTQPRLAAFAARTFEETFEADNTAEDIARHRAASYGVAQQAGEIADPDFITLLAVDESQLGRLCAAPAEPRARSTAARCGCGGVAVHVDRPWQGRGVAAPLMAAVRAAAQALGGRADLAQCLGAQPARDRVLYEKRLPDRGIERFLGGIGSADGSRDGGGLNVKNRELPEIRELQKPKLDLVAPRHRTGHRTCVAVHPSLLAAAGLPVAP